MTEQETKVLEIVKMRLGITDDSHDAPITSYIMEMEWRIKDYCKRSDIPEALIYTWASMAMDALRVENPNVVPAGVGGVVAGVKIGDTSIGAGGGGDVTATNKAVIDKIVLNYLDDLHRWRKLKW